MRFMRIPAVGAMPRSVLATVLLATAVSLVVRGQREPFVVVEATIPEMTAALEEGRVTSVEIVTQYLTRIATYEDTLHATLAVNRDALKDAEERDRERAQRRARGPLHGIPVAVKDNIHPTTMPTTGGALAFDGLVPP